MRLITGYHINVILFMMAIICVLGQPVLEGASVWRQLLQRVWPSRPTTGPRVFLRTDGAGYGQPH